MTRFATSWVQGCKCYHSDRLWCNVHVQTWAEFRELAIGDFLCAIEPSSAGDNDEDFEEENLRVLGYAVERKTIRDLVSTFRYTA